MDGATDAAVAAQVLREETGGGIPMQEAASSPPGLVGRDEVSRFNLLIFFQDAPLPHQAQTA